MSRNKLQTRPSERKQSPNQGEDSDESYVQDGSPEPETPAANKKASRQTRKPSSRSRSVEAPTGKTGKPTFPILTHRLTNISALPTINEEEEEGTWVREMSTNLSIERTQPNVIDVLAQICREILTNMIDGIVEASASSSKTTSKNKRTAVEAFGKDLDDELFTMSEALENRINLEARARKSKREKAALQAEYIEIRKEREQIALKCDMVRRRHWECEEHTRQRWSLSETARRVEQEIERSEAMEVEGFEFLLQSVTDSVSSATGHGGVLGKIKSFNAQLENMAQLLEGKGP